MLFTLLLGAACACGGRTSDSTESSDAGTSSPGSDAPSDKNQGNHPEGDLELGECNQGWPTYEADCPWLGSDELCYATKADACACVCPRDRTSTCVSGLPGGPDDRTRVSCF